MAWIKKKNQVNLVHQYDEQGLSIEPGDRAASLAYLRDFVQLIRPRRYELDKAGQNLQKAIRLLYEKPAITQNLRTAIKVHLRNTKLVPMFTESGLTLSGNMSKELYTRLKHKLIPPLRDDKDFLQVINALFYQDGDYKWVEHISRISWKLLFETLGLSFGGAELIIGEQVMVSLDILSSRITQLGWEKEIVNFLPYDPVQYGNPFMLIADRVRDMQPVLKSGDNGKVAEYASRAKRDIEKCLGILQEIRENTYEKGASLSQTFILLQIEQKLNRMLLLLDIIDADHQINTSRLSEYFIRVVRNENRKNSLREVLFQSAGYLAYQIAEQKGKKGNKYITITPVEYFQMIWSAMAGGFIICFVAIFKNLLGWLKLAPFWQGFVYSINYSIGFIVIEETKSTLATKQPAFTANAVAGTMDMRSADEGSPNLHNLAITLARVSRSQFASFFGNLIIVFPGTFILAWVFDLLFGFKIVDGEQAVSLLRDQHPFQSLSFLYACNTGFFLFLSGIIAGYVQNKMNFGRIGERIVQHPILQFAFSPQRLSRFAHYFVHHAGSLIGSISLGFFLGMAGTLGKIFGIPFDIRHITIAAGNVSIGLYGAGWSNLSGTWLLTVFIGVMGIGMFNFLVSFSLSFLVAVRSRGINFREFPEFFSILWHYFRKYPLNFIRPGKNEVDYMETASASFEPKINPER
jgi:site-specific recombinase